MDSSREQRTRRLTLKQQRFVNAYVDPKTASATAAARLAGYSTDVATEQACQNLALPHIRAAILAKQGTRSDKARAIFDRSAERVLADLEHSENPMHAVAAWKTAADVMQVLPEEVKHESPHLAALRVSRAILRALVIGAERPELIERFRAALARASR